MKAQQVKFRKPIKVLQVFTNVLEYTKADRSFDKRKEKLEWKPVASVHGHVQEGVLFLPASIPQHPALERCELITIKDSLHPKFNYLERMEDNDCLQLSAPRQLGCFKIKKAQTLELHLHYSMTYIGEPKRNNMKLCNLLPGEAVEVRINGKLDYEARTFVDHQYIFHYIGDFSEAKILPGRSKPFLKEIPVPAKLVDLLKPLW